MMFLAAMGVTEILSEDKFHSSLLTSRGLYESTNAHLALETPFSQLAKTKTPTTQNYPLLISVESAAYINKLEAGHLISR